VLLLVKFTGATAYNEPANLRVPRPLPNIASRIGAKSAVVKALISMVWGALDREV
jgi:hypothetical protein